MSGIPVFGIPELQSLLVNYEVPLLCAVGLLKADKFRNMIYRPKHYNRAQLMAPANEKQTDVLQIFDRSEF